MTFYFATVFSIGQKVETLLTFSATVIELNSGKRYIIYNVGEINTLSLYMPFGSVRSIVFLNLCTEGKFFFVFIHFGFAVQDRKL